MNKASIRALCLVMLAVLAGTALANAAAADLVSTQYGFPTIVKSGSTTTFSSDQATATDNEAINIGFAPFNDMMSGMPSSGGVSLFSGGSGFSPMTGQLITGFGNSGSLFDFGGLNLF